MKSRTIALAIFIIAFAFNFSIIAQSKDSKTTDNKVKTTIHKSDIKTTNDVKENAGTTVHHKNHQIKESKNNIKGELKSDLGKDMKKPNDEIKKDEVTTHKTEKKTETKHN